MIRYKRFWVAFLVVIPCLLVVSGLAQEELGLNYSDDEIRFQYPTGWAICDECEGYIVVSNTENGLYVTPEKITSADVQIAIFPSIEGLVELRGDNPDLGDTPADALEALLAIDAGPIETETVGSRDLAYVIYEAEDTGASAIMVIVERGDGSSAVLVASTAIGAAENYEEITLAIAETLTAANFVEATPTPIDPKMQGTPQPTLQTTNETIELTETFSLPDGSFTFRYPEGWGLTGGEREIAIYSDEAIFAFESAADFPDGAVLVAIYATPADFPDADFLESSGSGAFNASTAISFYASFAMAAGSQLDAPMGVFTLDGREASDVLILEPDGFERYYLAIEHEGDDSSMLQAIAAPGQIEPLKPLLQAIAVTFEVE